MGTFGAVNANFVFVRYLLLRKVMVAVAVIRTILLHTDAVQVDGQRCKDYSEPWSPKSS